MDVIFLGPKGHFVMNKYLYYWTWNLFIILLLYVWMKNPGHTYGGFVPAISERGMTSIYQSYLQIIWTVMFQLEYRSCWRFSRPHVLLHVHSKWSNVWGVEKKLTKSVFGEICLNMNISFIANTRIRTINLADGLDIWLASLVRWCCSPSYWYFLYHILMITWVS
jgi:hypothetical protein